MTSDTMNSPDDWETICIPIRSLINLSAVDFPLAVSPIAVGTGHAPVMRILINQFLACISTKI